MVGLEEGGVELGLESATGLAMETQRVRKGGQARARVMGMGVVLKAYGFMWMGRGGADPVGPPDVLVSVDDLVSRHLVDTHPFLPAFLHSADVTDAAGLGGENGEGRRVLSVTRRESADGPVSWVKMVGGETMVSARVYDLDLGVPLYAFEGKGAVTPLSADERVLLVQGYGHGRQRDLSSPLVSARLAFASTLHALQVVPDECRVDQERVMLTPTHVLHLCLAGCGRGAEESQEPLREIVARCRKRMDRALYSAVGSLSAAGRARLVDRGGGGAGVAAGSGAVVAALGTASTIESELTAEEEERSERKESWLTPTPASPSSSKRENRKGTVPDEGLKRR